MTDTEDLDVHPDDASPGVNRQFVLGGIVVALTLAIAAWLAYGVVQRSSPNPRAAGLVPDGANRGSGAVTTNPADGSDKTTTTKKGGTTTTTRKSGRASDGSSPPASNVTAPGGTGVASAVLWEAYSASWIDECRSIWKHSTNGKLYDEGDIGSYYTVDDCTRTLDRLFMTANVTSVAKAKTEGRSDAASFTEQLTLSGRLCWIDPATDETLDCWSNEYAVRTS